MNSIKPFEICLLNNTSLSCAQGHTHSLLIWQEQFCNFTTHLIANVGIWVHRHHWDIPYLPWDCCRLPQLWAGLDLSATGAKGIGRRMLRVFMCVWQGECKLYIIQSQYRPAKAELVDHASLSRSPSLEAHFSCCSGSD